MSEILAQPQSLREVLHPRVTPQMGFQSYECLQGNGAYRDTQKKAFIAGQVVYPRFDYPYMDVPSIQHGIRRLNDVLSLARSQPDELTRDAVWDSASYRMAEHYFVLSLEDLNRTYSRLDDRGINEKVQRTQELNEQLYGRPEMGISNAIKNELWARMGSKRLVGRAAQIRDELAQGVRVRIDDTEIDVLPLEAHGDERLPTIPEELLLALRQKLYRDNQDIVDLVNLYWENVVQLRPETDREFTPQDCMNLFRKIHEGRDPENISGISFEFEPDAANLAWDSSTVSIKIGTKKRSLPLDSPQRMIAKIFHEYVTHGGRTIAGIKSELPVLGTGLFTDADPGESCDYLTFEEGVASMGEVAVEHESYEWELRDLDKYLALSLAYEGNDFRQTYETLWRTYAVDGAKEGEDISQKAIDSAQHRAWLAATRIFRGTPTDLPRRDSQGQPRILTFNKDLAYLKGKLEVMEFWRRYSPDPSRLAKMLDLVYVAKFDPLNWRQLQITEKVYGLAA